MNVAAVIVAYDSGPLLLESVAALLASPRVTELVVVDNASRDGSIAAVQARHGTDRRLRVLTLPRNLGFAVAANAGARASNAAVLAIVNPDCRLEPEALEHLIEQLQRHPDTGILGALMVYPDGRIQPASLRRDPTPARTLRHLCLPSGEGIDVPLPSAPGLIEVEACSGALMLLPRTCFAALGGFDEGYFLHVEDLDLCRRARAAGWRVRVDTRIRVPHHKGSSSRRTPLAVEWHKTRGMLRYFRKFDAAYTPWPLRAVLILGAYARFAVAMPRAWLGRR